MRKKYKFIVLLNTPIFFSKRKGYSSNYMNLIDFILCISKKIKHLTLVLPVCKSGKGMINFDIPYNVEIISFPYYSGPFSLARMSYKIIPALIRISFTKKIRKFDLVGIVAPGTLSFITVPILYYFRLKPMFFIRRGHKLKNVHYRFDNYFKKMIAEKIVHVYNLFTKWMLRKKKIIMFSFGGLTPSLIKEYKFVLDDIFAIDPLIPKEIIKKKSTFSKVKHILYVGRLTRLKGINNLILAFNKIINEFQFSLTLHIVGSGPEEKNLKNYAEDLGILSLIEFYGFVPRGDYLWSIFDKCQILVLPSFSEGLPRVIGEAMARGLPVVSTKVGGIPSKIVDNKNGLLVKAGDIDGLKNAIVKLIFNEKLRKLLVQNGYRTALECTFEKEGDRMLDIIETRLMRIKK